MQECFPGLKTTGINANGKAVYSTADLAKALNISEGELMAEIEQRGMAGELRTGPVSRVH